jgi:hypothetical protein
MESPTGSLSIVRRRASGPARDLGQLESDMARVADDLRADPNRRWAVAHEIGA